MESKKKWKKSWGKPKLTLIKIGKTQANLNGTIDDSLGGLS